MESRLQEDCEQTWVILGKCSYKGFMGLKAEQRTIGGNDRKDNFSLTARVSKQRNNRSEKRLPFKVVRLLPFEYSSRGCSATWCSDFLI